MAKNFFKKEQDQNTDVQKQNDVDSENVNQKVDDENQNNIEGANVNQKPDNIEDVHIQNINQDNEQHVDGETPDPTEVKQDTEVKTNEQTKTVTEKFIPLLIPAFLTGAKAIHFLDTKYKVVIEDEKAKIEALPEHLEHFLKQGFKR